MYVCVSLSKGNFIRGLDSIYPFVYPVEARVRRTRLENIIGSSAFHFSPTLPPSLKFRVSAVGACKARQTLRDFRVSVALEMLKMHKYRSLRVPERQVPLAKHVTHCVYFRNRLPVRPLYQVLYARGDTV